MGFLRLMNMNNEAFDEFMLNRKPTEYEDSQREISIIPSSESEIEYLKQKPLDCSFPVIITNDNDDNKIQPTKLTTRTRMILQSILFSEVEERAKNGDKTAFDILYEAKKKLRKQLEFYDDIKRMTMLALKPTFLICGVSLFLESQLSI